jgi:hypothetical protein
VIQTGQKKLRTYYSYESHMLRPASLSSRFYTDYLLCVQMKRYRIHRNYWKKVGYSVDHPNQLGPRWLGKWNCSRNCPVESHKNELPSYLWNTREYSKLPLQSEMCWKLYKTLLHFCRNTSIYVYSLRIFHSMKKQIRTMHTDHTNEEWKKESGT